MSKYIKSFVEILKVLSLSAQKQLIYLIELGNPSVDELALEFDDLFLLAPSKLDSGELTHEQFKLLNVINLKFEEMGDLEKNWSESSLSNSEEWEELRGLAKLALSEMEKK